MPQRCPACDELVEMPAAVRPSEYLIKSELAALRAEVERLREACFTIHDAKETLPESDVYVLAYGKIQPAFRVDANPYQWFHARYLLAHDVSADATEPKWAADAARILDITHWMPMPRSPNELAAARAALEGKP